eukprot:40551-Eustigmatos_ZCMA.PRE.1
MDRRILNCVPDGPDARDLKLQFQPTSILTKVVNGNPLPGSVDLRNKMPVVYDQLSLGSCSCNATAAAHEYLQMRQESPNVFRPSRLYLYYYTRKAAGNM